ncbi:Hypothetical protein R9X50_00764900 [Acrodontium crateriforme]|uniref:Nucleolar pre-ribosomal-associated protein 1 n=1 Tax=Acrodontium crateriforme TaxID=150365 RepID=A0AAQ3RAW9_9PEZI|nr:Hypothetical protein R9X50_00764900 [Acrodontium crateriforme]
MYKRPAEQEDTSRPPKRSRPEQSYQSPKIDQIEYARQLQQLLTFRQDGLQQLRNGIASFKNFLETILYRKDEESRMRQLSILREYLDTQMPEDAKDPDRPFLGQLWQAWSFANQNNNDHLVSSISAVLALLLKLLSSLLDFRDFGLLLCRTVLLHPHLRLVKRCLDAPKNKDFVISPCLRLLTEVTSFDGGVLAREVYKRREQTFDISSLRRNLGLVKQNVDEEEARRKPSIRTLTVRYILASLKYLHEGAKNDMLKSRPLCISLFQYVNDDPADLVNEILSITEQHVLKDDEVQRSVKSTLLTEHNLERITGIATRSIEDHQAAEKAFDWLRSVCMIPSYGLLRQSAWYPPGTIKSEASTKEGTIDLGLDSLDFYDATERPVVRNTTLLEWIKTLRPQSSLRERELIMICFESAPELITAYFVEKNFQMEPKLTNTWIGYASFLFEVIKLSVPVNLGNSDGEEFADLPPQTTIMLENILPKCLSQKVLTRCLNQSSDLIAFFAIRILVLAFQKLADVQGQLQKAATIAVSGDDKLWYEASERLRTKVMERSPSMKDIITKFRKTPDDDDHVLQRESITRLLRLFYEVAPVQALEEQLDVSVALNAALAGDNAESASSEIRQMRSLELEHLLAIASQSSGMRWFNKQASLKYSPITTLIKLHTKDSQNRPTRSMIQHVLVDQSVLSGSAALDALIASLVGIDDDDSEVWTFIDDCLARANRQPVKYVDQLEAAASSEKKKDEQLPSVLVAVVIEQASFASDKADVQAWIGQFLGLIVESKDGAKTTKALQKSAGLKISKGSKASDESASLLNKVNLPVAAVNPTTGPTNRLLVTEDFTFAPPPSESEDHPQLLRWSRKDLELAIEDGDVDGLILCLCSQFPEVRKQALGQLRLLRAKLAASTVEDKEHIAVIIGELTETFEKQCLPTDKALPYLAGTFAARGLHVLTQPTHHMYPKINRYLIRSPEWRISKMPSYWLSNTALTQPDQDDSYWREVQWVLDWLVDGLRTPADLEILRRGNFFERAMALYSSPAASIKLVKEKVVELLYRGTCVEGGSNTLITRSGVIAWLDMDKRQGDETSKQVKTRVLETCDAARIGGWSGVSVATL